MSTIKYVEAKDLKGLEVIQDKAIKSVHSARMLIQVALVATILHMGKHGDWTVASRLVEGLGNTVNGKAVVEWLRKFGNLSTNDDGFTGFTNKDFKAAVLATLDEAKATMWYELKIVNPFKGYSLEAQLQQVIKNHKSVMAKVDTLSKDEQDKVDVTVNDATIRQVLALCKFDAIIADASNTDTIAAEIAALEKVTTN
jgi:hypothetical protein